MLVFGMEGHGRMQLAVLLDQVAGPKQAQEVGVGFGVEESDSKTFKQSTSQPREV